MPRTRTPVKTKLPKTSNPGLIDLHFHGAFGIDLMTATPDDLDRLAARLGRAGLAAFCPTTLSVSKPELLKSVARLGQWITRFRPHGTRSAVPLGIHLEGPFLSPAACGAHPPRAIRPFDPEELDQLWNASLGTVRILTLAPELLSPAALKTLVRYARKRGIHLSAGHSRATTQQAKAAFDAGFRGVTHAWNAMAFQTREAGVLGAALGRKDVFVELIADQVHVSPEVMSWTMRLHPQTCLVSDCVPAAGHRGICAFGPLQVEVRDGAARLADGQLAGGGVLLPRAFEALVHAEARRTGENLRKTRRRLLPLARRNPLRAIRGST